MGTWLKNSPTVNDKIKEIPAILQDNFDAIEDAYEIEHYSPASANAVPGAHRLGAVGAIGAGTTVELTGSSPSSGALAYDTTRGILRRYNGTSWDDIGSTYWSRLRAYRSSNIAVTAGASAQTLIYDTENYDTLGEYDNATGIFTAKASGYYIAMAQISMVASGTQLDTAIVSATGRVGTYSWTPSGNSSNYINIDEYPTPIDTDLNITQTSGNTDTFSGSLPSMPSDSGLTNVTVVFRSRRRGCVCNSTCYGGYVACSCNNTCYGDTSCSCNNSCYGYDACTCHNTAYGYAACSCNNTCYGYAACSCNAQCYGYAACTCNSTCYGYVACSCNSTCYGYVACSCNDARYGYSACTCNNVCYVYEGAYGTCTCNNTCYGYSACSCDYACYGGYSACTCNLACHGQSCTCNNQCYGDTACSCNNQCYGDTACSCNNTCYGGYSACSCNNTCYTQTCACNSTTYGAVGCSCNSTCYGYVACTCNNTCYGYVACTCNNTCYGGYSACTCNLICYGDTGCSCNSTCYGYTACSCNNTCYTQDATRPAAVLRKGGTNYLGDTTLLTSAFVNYSQSWANDPTTGLPWTAAGVSGIQGFGYTAVVGTTGCSADISQCYLQLIWFPPRPVIGIHIYKNNNLFQSIYRPIKEPGIASWLASYQVASIFSIVFLSAGDTIKIAYTKTMENDTLYGGTAYTFLAIHRLPVDCL